MPNDTRNKYTVVLLYPDYMQESGHETYIESVLAENADKAIEAVQRLAVGANTVEDIDPNDFALLALFAGHPDLLLSNV